MAIAMEDLYKLPFAIRRAVVNLGFVIECIPIRESNINEALENLNLAIWDHISWEWQKEDEERRFLEEQYNYEEI